MKQYFNKKAFTFAELMISLVVIAVITLILYPTISDLAPNNNEYLFKSAYKTIEMVTSDIMNTPNQQTMPTDTQQHFCEVFCNKLNTTIISPTDGNCSTCTSFITSNGMRWAFATSGGNGYVLVDVNASNNKTNDETDDAKKITTTGFAYANPWNIPAANMGMFRPNPEDTVVQDTFEIQITQLGKILIRDSVGTHHMQNPGD
ncbi:MAG: prepilin-type N-terminal cleavage/methylation domain-containing protein [Candidatus Gastranaerophilales bacterium]|nr:prepilin-type N-terminal cleavage/methylation domain-containing protein [Candidatus Gastranaerophilales bacterium]